LRGKTWGWISMLVGYLYCHKAAKRFCREQRPEIGVFSLLVQENRVGLIW
jgi:hypothetical protein